QPEETRRQMMNDMANQFREKPQSAVESKAEQIIQKVQEEDVTQVLQKKKFAQVETSEERIRITLTNPVLFLSGEAVLSDGARREIRDLAPLLASLPNKILVEGHTDNQPVRQKQFASNWELSVARASSVVEFFTRECGIPSERFILAGYGEYRPVSDNDTPDGRRHNRRIEINILRKAA
ncbi:MAG TPA: OmpA family protein, partial [Elusimicrobiota bacterium]|nr:OmpA family protein [Elusimicrobiota bacterium]